LAVLSNSLSWIEHSYPLKLAAKFLRLVLERRTVLQLFLRHKTAAPNTDSMRLRTSWKETVNIIGSLPDRMANRFQKDLDPFFFSECALFLSFFLLLVSKQTQQNKHRNLVARFLKDSATSLRDIAQESHLESREYEDFLRLGFAELVRKFCALGQTGFFSSSFLSFILSYIASAI